MVVILTAPLFFVFGIGLQPFAGAGRGEPSLIDVVDKTLEEDRGNMNRVALLRRVILDESTASFLAVALSERLAALNLDSPAIRLAPLMCLPRDIGGRRGCC